LAGKVMFVPDALMVDDDRLDRARRGGAADPARRTLPVGMLAGRSPHPAVGTGLRKQLGGGR
jgi:hypothetical protein